MLPVRSRPVSGRAAERAVVLWLDGAHGPDENMRRDAALFEAAEQGALAPIVVRLFRFEPESITLGRAQVPAAELDLDACARDGIPFASRPTGGRAVFHAREWTISVTVPVVAAWGASAAECHERTTRWIAAALNLLGVPVRAARARRGGAVGPRGAGTAARACFSSVARHELLLHDRKVLGLAQRLGRRALLQQGSLLIGPGHERIVDYQRLAPEVRATRRDALERTAADIGWPSSDGDGLSEFAKAMATTGQVAEWVHGPAGSDLVAPR